MRLRRAARLLAAWLPLAAAVPGAAQEDFRHPELAWRTIETPHFLVHYHEGAERTARVSAKVAEEIYGPVTALYRHEPDGKVSIVVKDYDDYANGAAYFYDNKIEIWASSLDTDLRGTHNWLRNVITHEFTHIVQIQTSFKFGRRVPAVYLQYLGYESERRQDVLYGFPNRIVSYPISGFVIPSWFAEGVAQFNRRELDYDRWDSHRDMILRSYALDGTMLSWNEMAVFGKTSLGNESSYNAGFAFVAWLVERYGEEVLDRVSRNLSAFGEVTIDGAIERATGTGGEELYRLWQEELRADYAERTAGIRAAPAAGRIVGDVGFANLHPAYSPDGSTLAYLSNKRGDYFSSTGLWLRDVASGTERRLAGGVRSKFSWSPDGATIYAAKHTRDNPFWSSRYDLFAIDAATGDERRLTEGLRANAPAVSPDGRRIAFVSGGDGTLNLHVVDADGRNVRRLTRYASGEQVYNPVWTPDGAQIVFEYSLQGGRDILRISAAGGEPEALVATADDERGPAFGPGGALHYASDRTGIFNIYRLDPAADRRDQLTSVLGGAFTPAVSPRGALAYAHYTSEGYKIAVMDDPAALGAPAAYDRPGARRPGLADFPGLDGGGGGAQGGTNGPASDAGGEFDWSGLRAYDDTSLPPLADGPYSNATTSLTVIPFLRIDNYNPRNRGLEVLKPGAYLFSSDMLDRYGFFAGAAMNWKGERDLFFTFDYAGAIPGFFQLGWDPRLSLEAYNITRTTGTFIPLPLDTIPVDVSYNLIEFDAVFRQKVFAEWLDASYGYRHSRYTADIGSFFLPEAGVLVPATSILYYKGNNLFLELRGDLLAQSRTREINPVGVKFRFRYDYEFNDFDPADEVNERGELAKVFRDVNFHRLEMDFRRSHALPGWSHTLAARARAGTIAGPPVDDFFDFYLGGMTGMRGYPFYSAGGNEYLHGSLAYRFPVWEGMDIRFLQFTLDRLYGTVYADAGAAWSGGSPSGRRFIRDAGAELRLESFSFYAYPTRIFFSATYGFDRFTRYVESRDQAVTYGGEWQFHFGVLFGFDFD